MVNGRINQFHIKEIIMNKTETISRIIELKTRIMNNNMPENERKALIQELMTLQLEMEKK